MEKQADISCKYVHDPYARMPRRIYSWVGDVRWPLVVEDYTYDEIKDQWPLKKVAEDWSGFRITCLRTDVRYWRFTEARIKVRRAWEWFNVRLLATMYVWGLLVTKPGVSYGWSDLKIVKWLRNK